MTKTRIKFSIKESPARLKLAALIDQRNVIEEKLHGLAGGAEQSVVLSKLRDIEAAVRLAAIYVILDEAQSVVAEFDSAAQALVRQVGAAIQTLDDFAAITKASGCKHGDLQGVYARQVQLNEQIDKIGKTLFQQMNVVAAEAAAAKWTGVSSHSESPLAVLAEALVNNPMATLEAS